jgi:hypothetical protein
VGGSIVFSMPRAGELVSCIFYLSVSSSASLFPLPRLFSSAMIVAYEVHVHSRLSDSAGIGALPSETP